MYFSVCLSVLVCALITLGPASFAASKFKKSLYTQSLNKKSERYIQDGVVIGGEISKGFTLLNVRRGISKKTRMERVVLDIGDLAGKPAKSELAFYHVNVDAKRRQIVIDLNQVARSGIDQKQMAGLFKKSPYVKSAEITFDPEDLTTSILLRLKKPTKVEVFNLVSAENPSRIVLDLKGSKSRSDKKAGS